MTRPLYDLTLLSGFCLTLGIVIVNLLSTGQLAGAPVLACLGLTCFWLTIQSILGRSAPHIDRLVLPLLFFLTAIGLIFIFRLKPQLFYAQVFWAVLGAAAFSVMIFYRRKLYLLNEYMYTIGLVGITLLVATLLFGVDIGGNKNWIVIGSFRVQPSEIAKLCIVLFIAGYLSSRREELVQSVVMFGPLQLPHLRFIAPLLVVWGFAMLMLVIQRDLGAALLYFGTALILTCMASGRWGIAVLGGVFFLAGSSIAYLLFPHVGARLDIWLNPWADPNGRAYQLLQSLFALGSGGIFGSGIASGHPDLIPEVHTDFIFSAIGEELGFTGTACLLLIYMILLYRAFRIAGQNRSLFGALTTTGLAVLFGLQIFIILAGTTNLLPMTGITLPFISYGGSSLLASFILMGIVAAFSDEVPNESAN